MTCSGIKEGLDLSMERPKRLKICLVCSVGGHLNQIMLLSSFYRKHEYYFLTFYRGSVAHFGEREKVYFIKDPSRNVAYFAVSFWQSVKIFLRESPDLILSTGAGVAVATCFLGWLLRKRVVFIEDWCRIDKPSVSGRLVYPIASLFFVQHKGLKRFYRNAVYQGALV